MLGILSRNLFVYKTISALAIIAIFAVSSAYSQTALKVYAIELVVREGKKSVETDADITFNGETFTVVPDKPSYKSEIKELRYADVKSADKSFAKKPLLSAGGAVALALLTLAAIPLLFVKKKKHWMTVQTE